MTHPVATLWQMFRSLPVIQERIKKAKAAKKKSVYSGAIVASAPGWKSFKKRNRLGV